MALGHKKYGPQSIGKSRGGWNTKIHLVAADARTAVTFSLSPGQAHDGPVGRRLKGYRRIFSRFEKLDAMFLGFLSFVLVADGLRSLWQQALVDCLGERRVPRADRSFDWMSATDTFG